MRTVTITVTADDIAKHGPVSGGFDRRCASCPVAMAMTRALCKQVWVIYRSWGFDECMEFDLPPEVADKIHAIDKGNFPEPFSFEVGMPV